MSRKIMDSAKVIEPETWIQVDEETGEQIGEPKEVNVVFKRTDRSGFMITYLATIMQMIDALGNQKMNVVKYLLSKMNRSNNLVVKTIDEISEESGISKKTICETLKALEKANIISRRPGIIMLSPKLVHRGDAKREHLLLTRFCEM